jgi:hypothetical protein
MKKIVLTTMMAIATMTGFAQHRVGTVTVQPKIALNVADLTDTEGGSRVGLGLGAEFEFQISPIFSMSAGAIYSQQGNEDAKLDYINIPILANVYVTRGLAVKVGLQPEFNVNDDNYSHVNSTTLSIPVGLSYEYHNFVWDARYNFGSVW